MTDSTTADVHGPAAPRLIGMLAKFDGPDQLVAAVVSARESGFRVVDAFSPFPIHALDAALRIRPTRLPWIVLAAGLLGGLIATTGQWWMNAIDYPYITSGKPLFSLPANIPVTFELTILFAAFAAFLGMLLLNGLPKFVNPLSASSRFRSATTDGFLLLLDASTRQFSPADATSFLRQAGAIAIEECHEQSTTTKLPRGIYVGLAIVGVMALVPPIWIARGRSTNWEVAPLRSFKDMDFQPKFKSQTAAGIFDDGRAMRPAVAGTVARGQLPADVRFATGLEPARQDSDKPEWTTDIPIPVSSEVMRRGRQQYNIVCATCHGRAGDGNGPVSKRALALEQGTWIQPTSLHAQHVRDQPAGQLFGTITNGIRKMPGYADQLSPADRWAIVTYLRALQRTRTASSQDLPAAELPKLRELN